jgi:hypothetical protein
MTPTPPIEQSPWATLRKFARPRPPVERCDLCAAALSSVHSHLIEPASRRLQCSCEPCAILFSDRQDGRFRRVRPRAERLPDFRLDDRHWEDLHLPINLAFFVASGAAGADRSVQAFFPSPAGATESLLSLDAWEELVAENPVLRGLEPDVEALLVNRLGPARDYYLVSIDECFKLAGLIRCHWRGLSGGTRAWEEIAQFFNELNARSPSTSPGGTHRAGPEL